MGLAHTHTHAHRSLIQCMHSRTRWTRMRAAGTLTPSSSVAYERKGRREGTSERATMQCHVAFFLPLLPSSFLGSFFLPSLPLTAARILMRRGRRRQCPLWECSPALLVEYHVCSISALPASVASVLPRYVATTQQWLQCHSSPLLLLHNPLCFVAAPGVGRLHSRHLSLSLSLSPLHFCPFLSDLTHLRRAAAPLALSPKST